MAQVVELEGAASAVQPGAAIALEAGVSTQVSTSRRRKATILFNDSEETIWLRFHAEGNSGKGTAVPIPAGSGYVVKDYHGALCCWSEKANEIHIAEF